MGLACTDLKLWIPFIMTLLGICTGLVFLEIIVPQLALRFSCLDHGFAEDCNEDVAIKAISQLSLYSSTIPAFLTLFTLPIYGALSNRLGRKGLMCISLLGPTLLALAWFLIVDSDNAWIRSHWRLMVILSCLIAAFSGSGTVINLVFYSSLSDIVQMYPKARTTMFVFVELSTTLMTVVGIEGAGYILDHQTNSVAVRTMLISMLVMIPLTALFYPETTPKELRKAPIDKSALTLFGPLRYMCHCFSKTASDKLNDDFTTIYDRLVIEREKILAYRSRNGDDITLNGVGNDQGSSKDDDKKESLLNKNDLNQKTSYNTKLLNKYGITNTGINSTQSDIIDPTAPPEYGLEGSLSSSSLLAPEDFVTSSSSLTTPNSPSKSSNTIAVLDDNVNMEKYNDPKYPDVLSLGELKRIPHRNNLLLFSTVITLNLIIYFGLNIATYYFLKQQWNITPIKYSRVMTYSTIGGVAASFFLFPLFKMCFKTPNQEVWLVSMVFLIQGGALCVQATTKSYTMFALANITAKVILNFPGAIMRSLMLNNVTEASHPLILTLFGIIGSIANLAGTVAINFIWIKVQDHHSWVIWAVTAGVAFLSAFVMLVFRSDSTQDFNLRNDMLKIYSEVLQYEKKIEQEREKKETGENNGESNQVEDLEEPLLFPQQLEYEAETISHVTHVQ